MFFFGDMNFRLDLPASHPLYETAKQGGFADAIASESVRKDLVEYDQLTREMKKGTIFVGLHEGEFWRFKCSFKYKIGQVDEYR